ncbi:MAG: sugar-binding domain-containing protein [Luteolibacter sp.]
MKPYSLLLLLLSLQAATADWKPVEGKMLTPWGAKLDPAAVWAEYPRPQLQRKNWTNLNGLWSYAIAGQGDDEAVMKRLLTVGTKEEDAAVRTQLLMGEILIPFCPESSLSGVGKLIEPEQSLWYRRSLPAKPITGERTLLHFEAVDYETTVWVNGKEVGKHIGGNTPFSFDITQALTGGDNSLLVRVHDATEGWQLRGKQALKPQGITATRVTGIWQTVWLEQVPARSIEDLDFISDIETGTLNISTKLTGQAVKGEVLRVTASIDGKDVVTQKGNGNVSLKIPEPRLWTPETPNLYDLKVELLDRNGKPLDTVQSYTALRNVGKTRDTNGNLRIALNGKEIFLLGPLEQGWWPDGLLTPPSEEAMVSDLKFIKAAGFNMLRKHVKVENARFYYHCDRLGLAVWQDQVSAGMWDKDPPQGCSPKWISLTANPQDATWPDDARQQWVTEYKAMVDHLRDHPSILIWCPFNEAWGQHDSMEIGKMAVDYDPTRLLCIACGGNFWPVGDIASKHHYPDPEFPLDDKRFHDFIKVVGELGGHAWAVEGHLWNPEIKHWGYSMPGSLDDWKIRYRRSMELLTQLHEEGISAGIYTQTSDFETEVNGLQTYDRIPKVDASWLKPINEGVILGRAATLSTRRAPPNPKP